MKIRRSERLVDMTQYFLEHPHTFISLSFFTKRYQSAKSSISEDLTILKNVFAERGTGELKTLAGAAGGIYFIPRLNRETQETFIQQLANRLSDEDRLLPGGYVYLSDLLGEPEILHQIGRLISSKYADQEVDVVMTVATKGVPIAQAVASFLNIPFVMVRRNSKITEGATVSVNYASGSSHRIEKMELSKRSLPKGSRVLVVDDFMKGGGTIAGMMSLIEEFDSTLVGIAVFAEARFHGERAVKTYDSLLYVRDVDVKTKTITVVAGNYLDSAEYN